MKIEIKAHNVERFQAALDRRHELLRMRTNDMPRDFGEQLSETHRIIAAAVSVAANSQHYGEQNVSMSRGSR